MMLLRTPVGSSYRDMYVVMEERDDHMTYMSRVLPWYELHVIIDVEIPRDDSWLLLQCKVHYKRSTGAHLCVWCVCVCEGGGSVCV